MRRGSIKKTQSIWEKVVFHHIKDLTKNLLYPHFTRENLIKQKMNIIIKETNSLGKTPKSSISLYLQRLRDKKLIIFSKRGEYVLTKQGNELSCLSMIKIPYKGEFIIYQILRNYGISFECQKKFNDLVHKGKLSLDFYFIYQDMQYAIEYDGIQHFKPVTYFGGEKTFIEQQKRDVIKNIYCKKNNINLLRIPYLKIKEIDIILSNFLNKY